MLIRKTLNRQAKTRSGMKMAVSKSSRGYTKYVSLHPKSFTLTDHLALELNHTSLYRRNPLRQTFPKLRRRSSRYVVLLRPCSSRWRRSSHPRRILRSRGLTRHRRCICLVPFARSYLASFVSANGKADQGSACASI